VTLDAEYAVSGVIIRPELKKQAGGGCDFIVRDLDGDGLCFVGPASRGLPSDRLGASKMCPSGWLNRTSSS
jgi:hypothetical protein